jgi:hypothetical protein
MGRVPNHAEIDKQSVIKVIKKGGLGEISQAVFVPLEKLLESIEPSCLPELTGASQEFANFPLAEELSVDTMRQWMEKKELVLVRSCRLSPRRVEQAFALLLASMGLHFTRQITGETVATWAGTPVKIAASPEAGFPHHALLDVGAGMAASRRLGEKRR